ncbi:MAG: NifU family protein [Bacteroidota bacterium]
MKRTVIMHVEGVPNPNAMKFVLENGILVDRPYEFANLVQAEHSPLARRLLMLRYVDRVLLNHNFVTVVKDIENSPSWDDMLFEVKMLIQAHLEDDKPIIFFGVEEIKHQESDEAIIEIITRVLDEHIRPAAQEDGGDIVFDSYKDGVLNLSMKGACHYCPYAGQTMSQGVEKVMMGMVPEIRQVTATGNPSL